MAEEVARSGREQQTRVVADERGQRRSVPRKVDVEVAEGPITSLPNEAGSLGDLSVVRRRVEVGEVDVVGRPNRRPVEQEDEVVRVEVVHVPTLERQVEGLAPGAGLRELNGTREGLDVHIEPDLLEVCL